MWFFDVKNQFNHMLVPGRIKVNPSIEKEFLSYTKLLLSIMEQIKHEVHLGESQALKRWLPEFFDKTTGVPTKPTFSQRINIEPFPGESVNWIEFNEGISVCVMYVISGDIITVFPIFQMPKDTEWWPSLVYATIGNGKTFRQLLGDDEASRKYRHINSIPDERLDDNLNFRVVSKVDSIDKKVLDFHNRIVGQSITILEHYGHLLNVDWTVMGDEVIKRSERRYIEHHGQTTVERKVLAVVENGVARMVGSFKCPTCRDSGFNQTPEMFCSCEIGQKISKSTMAPVEQQELVDEQPVETERVEEV